MPRAGSKELSSQSMALIEFSMQASVAPIAHQRLQMRCVPCRRAPASQSIPAAKLHRKSQ